MFNLGNGNGYSVKEVSEMTRIVTRYPMSTEVKERRKGDPATLVVSSEKAKVYWNGCRSMFIIKNYC